MWNEFVERQAEDLIGLEKLPKKVYKLFIAFSLALFRLFSISKFFCFICWHERVKLSLSTNVSVLLTHFGFVLWIFTSFLDVLINEKWERRKKKRKNIFSIVRWREMRVREAMKMNGKIIGLSSFFYSRLNVKDSSALEKDLQIPLFVSCCYFPFPPFSCSYAIISPDIRRRHKAEMYILHVLNYLRERERERELDK